MAQSANGLRRRTASDTVDEITPLLSAADPKPPSYDVAVVSAADGKLNTTDTDESRCQDDDEDEIEKPMPYIQVLLLCYASLAEPVAYFSIFPFVNQMIERTGGLKETDVGYWSGAIESLFSLVQMVLMIFYGRTADRLGRKPVLVFSLAGVSIATALFGLSQTLWQMVLFRCLAGVFAGSVVTVRTMLSENCTKSNQGRAFSWYMFTRNLGIFLGPLVGGGLANPTEQFPGTFGESQFLKRYPYILATVVAGTVCLSGMILTLLFLKETLVRRQDGSGIPEATASTWEVLKSPGVPIVLYILGHTSLLGLGYTAVVPVFEFTSVHLGGFGFSPAYISYFLALVGGCQALWMLVLFPPLQRRFGTGNVMRIAAVGWPITMVLFPILNEFRRYGYNTAFFAAGTPLIVLSTGVCMSYACTQLFINDISPSKSVLATLNALALTVGSAVRAFTPALFTSIFALGVKIQWADGHLVWVFLVAIGVLLNVPMYFLPERAEGRPKKKAPRDRSSELDSNQVENGR